MILVAILLATLAAGIGSVWVADVLLRVGFGRGSAGRAQQGLLSLAAGALLATAFMHLLPEAFDSGIAPQPLFATLLVGLPKYRTMPVEMYGVILDYPATAGAVFALILLIPNILLLTLMRRYVGPETLSKGFKM